MKDESKLWKLWHWYIRGEYHCDQCPYSWEDRGPEDADAGCWLFSDGELRDTCRYVRNPISKAIVNKKRNMNDSQYDGWEEYGKQMSKAYDLAEKYEQRIRQECLYDIIWDIIREYEHDMHPHETPWKTLKTRSRHGIRIFGLGICSAILGVISDETDDMQLRGCSSDARRPKNGDKKSDKDTL